MKKAEPNYIVTLTPSQRMALMDVILMVMTPPIRLAVCVDVVRNVETTPDQLLFLVSNARPESTVTSDDGRQRQADRSSRSRRSST